MSFLFGSQPTIQQVAPQQPTINPTQQAILQQLQGELSSGAQPPGVQPYGGTFSAPLNPLQLSSLQGFENLANTVPNTPSTVNPQQTADLYSQLLNYGGPGTLAAPTGPSPITSTGVTPQSITAPQIDASQLIQQSIVAPAQQLWNQSILPGIIGNYGRSAGGAYSSDAEQARAQAGEQLATGVASAAGTAGYNAAAANQAAQLAAATNNQNLNLQGQEFTAGENLTAQEATAQNQLTTSAQDLTAGQTNINSSLATQQALLAALGAGPTVAGTPFTEPSLISSILASTLGAGAVPYAQQQQQVTGSYQDFLNQLAQAQQIRATQAGTFSPQTLSGSTFASLPGSTGLIPGALTGLSSNAGLGLSLATLLSDERAKEDVHEIGSLDNDVKIVLFRYKGSRQPQIGVIAQDVERKVPGAVYTAPNGAKYVNYGSVVSDALLAA